MLIALLMTDYPPLRSSAAVQMRDLAAELVKTGHEPTVIIPDSRLATPWTLQSAQGVRVLRVASSDLRAGGNVHRTIVETLLPFVLYRGLRRSPLRDEAWDAVVWYSPSIFFGPLVWLMRRKRRFSTYLILRDIFPEWTVDLRIMRKGPAYGFFKVVAALQYWIADTIGIQSPSNAVYLQRWSRARQIEVLQNWLAPAPNTGCRLQIANTTLADRTVFVYIGNMGVAQSLDIFLDAAELLQHRADIGFLFVGRGTDSKRLAAEAKARDLRNMLFHDKVEPEEISGLLAQCHVGLVALDPRHKTHNVPGKFLSYMQAGLPVLARVNVGIDLADLIEREHLGSVYVGDSAERVAWLVQRLADAPEERQRMAIRAHSLAQRLFSPSTAARQILAAVAGGATNGSVKSAVSET
jgi:glycosyltransferase involved in cell wall biosynthesis